MTAPVDVVNRRNTNLFAYSQDLMKSMRTLKKRMPELDDLVQMYQENNIQLSQHTPCLVDDMTIDIKTFIETLPEHKQLILEMYVLRGETVHVIAEIMGVSSGRISQLLHGYRGRTGLLKKLADHMEEYRAN